MIAETAAAAKRWQYHREYLIGGMENGSIVRSVHRIGAINCRFNGNPLVGQQLVVGHGSERICAVPAVPREHHPGLSADFDFCINSRSPG